MTVQTGLEQFRGPGEKRAQVERRMEKVANTEANGPYDDIHLRLRAKQEDGGGALVPADVFREGERLFPQLRSVMDDQIKLLRLQRYLQVAGRLDVARIEPGFHRDIRLGLEHIRAGAD